MDEPIRGPVHQDADGGKMEADSREGVTKPKIDWKACEYHKKRQILEAHHDDILEKIRSGVTLRVIHREYGISRTCITNYIADHEDLKAAWEDAKEDLLDLNEEIVNEIATMDCDMVETEMGMFPRVDGRSLSTKFNAAKLRLERLGAKRGWNAKLETNEVGNGIGRVPVIFCGQVPDAEIAECEAQVAAANEDAEKGLEGIPKG